jgi:hypothetical protein
MKQVEIVLQLVARELENQNISSKIIQIIIQNVQQQLENRCKECNCSCPGEMYCQKHIEHEINTILNNEYVLTELKKQNQFKISSITQEMASIAPGITHDILVKLYEKAISLHQSKNWTNGNFLEKLLASSLRSNGIIFKEQVTINDNGVIIGVKNKNKYHIIDFVIQDTIPIEIGRSITDFKVVSCKTTCRERWTQDNWSFQFRPKLFLLLTLSDDYPSPSRFREDTNRKIVTCNPKKDDNRLFKLDFEDLINVLRF